LAVKAEGACMAMTDARAEIRFDRFAAQLERRQVLVDGRPAKVGARAFDILMALIERRERVVARSELMDLVWPDIAVEEGNLPVHIAALRKLLGPKIIATIPGRGYKFAAPIEGMDAPVPAAVQRAEVEAPRSPGNLPAQLPPLYGREGDVAALAKLTDEHQLVSVVGPGGIGKTRVAQAVAHGLRGADRDGAWIVELAPIEKPELIVSTVARLLGHALGGEDAAGASLLEAMREQQLLLVLDNCEHLIDAVADFAQAILAQAPGVRLLATSQEPLRLREEQVYRLGQLDVPASADPATAQHYGAVALFAARATASDARFKLAGNNVGDVVDICSRLDGIALAIELAAARVSLLGVHGLRQRLRESLKLLAGGAREALPRHRTLHAALQWSYGLLTEDEQTVLDRLGIFVGGFSLEAAQHLASDERIDEIAALDCLGTLIDKSLVLVDAGEPPRYHLLESTRAFALERLAAKGATQAMRRRHVQALVATLRKSGVSESPARSMARTAPDLDNVRAAAAWATGPDGDRTLAIELVSEADFLWGDPGCLDEAASLFRIVEPWIDATTPPAVAARLWLSRSRLWLYNAVRGGAEAGRRAADLYRSLGDREGLFLAQTSAALQWTFAGEMDEANRALAEARSLLDPAWPPWTLAQVEHSTGTCEVWGGNPEDGRKHLRAAIEFFSRDSGDAFFAMQGGVLLLICDFAQRRFQAVARACADSLSKVGARLPGLGKVYLTTLMGGALAQCGDLDGAEAALRTALPMVKRAGQYVHGALNHVAFLVARQGRIPDAARLIGYIDAAQTPELVVKHPAWRLSYDDAIAIVAPALGASEFERLRREGGTLTEDEAVALALPEKN